MVSEHSDESEKRTILTGYACNQARGYAAAEHSLWQGRRTAECTTGYVNMHMIRDRDE